MTPILSHETFDIAAHVRPGDRIVVGQCTAEPLTLTETLVQAAPAIGTVDVFLGTGFSRTFRPDGPENLRLSAYGATGTNVALSRAGRLDVLPMHYSALAEAYAGKALTADVVLIQLRQGRNGLSLGLANDYVAQAARHARTVIAEVNPDVPETAGSPLPDGIEISAFVAAAKPPVEAQASRLDEVAQRIGAHLAALIPDRATLQIGIGAIPDATLAALGQHRDLGIHSGVATDRVLDLIGKGVVTNRFKPFDQGVTVANTLIGTRRLYDFADGNAAVEVRPTSHTHDYGVLRRIDRFHAINSAIEVDLTGQVNSEMAGGVCVGGVGGLVDFARGGRAAPGGRAIIALPSTAAGGTVSRIVPRVAAVTLPHSDVDLVVTEHGVADMRGVTLAQRAERMIAIADPAFREDLARHWRDAASGQR
ncbi:MAG: 4-hydroxybutyrate CoA-transferase [Proteobacteria bacterium]|nr:4-hydroxybutyrate CoA-transferase [Pseudomonadota bacterium]